MKAPLHDVKEVGAEALIMRDHVLTPAPWLAFPEHQARSLFWKMGAGSDYLTEWTSWFVSQSKAERDLYLEKFAPPENWSGYLESVEEFYLSR